MIEVWVMSFAFYSRRARDKGQAILEYILDPKPKNEFYRG